MAFCDIFKKENINDGVIEQNNTKGSLLIDVREDYEYANGHIPGSINIPVGDIEKIKLFAIHKDMPLFVYCYSGHRSSKATGILKNMGYTNVKNIGGISSYKGKIETLVK